MRPSNSVWQGNFGYWQDSFIHNNLLVIGYTAWKGFQSFGRGVVLCNVDIQVTHPTITNLDTVPFTLQFLPSNLIGFYLRSQSLSSFMISSIFPTVATYNPDQDILLVLKAEHQIEINFLHNLKITPPDCYKQVCKRWSEFQPILMS
ncbi:MAG: hypothetical protein RMY28_016530 [Nostoc sp. ChiSLP01]|nr:hypothetical protein [Nostoc sp. CmiSLP01]MDZ8288642.1 hypothetical protein [Nostoc sp. ChiSLP01]